jgi:hypothetical protein
MSEWAKPIIAAVKVQVRPGVVCIILIASLRKILSSRPAWAV